MNVKHLLKLAIDYQLKVYAASPEDRVRADKGLVSRLNAWAASSSVKTVNINVQKGKFHEITFDDKKDPAKEKSFKASFETDILSKAAGFEGWITLQFPLVSE
jgi:hypothetical protein